MWSLKEEQNDGIVNAGLKLLLIYVVLRALRKIDVYLISTLVNKSLYYYYQLQFFLKSHICVYGY